MVEGALQGRSPEPPTQMARRVRTAEPRLTATAPDGAAPSPAAALPKPPPAAFRCRLPGLLGDPLFDVGDGVEGAQRGACFGLRHACRYLRMSRHDAQRPLGKR
jgi:hypothetical protein